ncbi:hypothetical protein OROMI_016439 [Orobanche minor]
MERYSLLTTMAGNISRCVKIKPPTISGLKRHDNHILMQQLLPIAIRKTLPKCARYPLIRLSRYFRELCSKVEDPREVMFLEKDIAEILCQLEKYFPPTFFDSMVHLTIHLATEVRLGGPIHYRWMYPIERYLGSLKPHVRNRNRPEGSMAEGYIAEECLNFCSHYLADYVGTKFNRLSRNEVDAMDEKFELDDIHPQDPSHLIKCQHTAEFPEWFAENVYNLTLDHNETLLKELKCLARGLDVVGHEYAKYLVNGFRFHTKDVELTRKMQNSGVTVNATSSGIVDPIPADGEEVYYGVLKNIIQLSYGRFKAAQVFNVDDPTESNWKVVIPTNARAGYNMELLPEVEMYFQSDLENSRVGFIRICMGKQPQKHKIGVVDEVIQYPPTIDEVVEVELQQDGQLQPLTTVKRPRTRNQVKIKKEPVNPIPIQQLQQLINGGNPVEVSMNQLSRNATIQEIAKLCNLTTTQDLVDMFKGNNAPEPQK